MAVEAQFCGVGEVGTELDEEGAEVGVETVEVVVVHYAARLHDPGVGVASCVAAFLGREHGGLLLRTADEHHALSPAGRLEQGELFVHHVVLALTLHEIDPRDQVRGGERMDLFVEPVRDRSQRNPRGNRQPEMMPDVADHSADVLEPWLVDVAVHPVDALQLETDVLG